MTELEALQQIITDMGTYQQANVTNLQLFLQEIVDSMQMYSAFFAVSAVIIIFLLVVLVVRSM